jgi:4-diphosphocytidyl-2-C-methyl-D-erythritol kinase
LELKDFQSEFFNDFEKLVFTNHPQLKMIKTLLYQEGALFAALSGSGSSVFGLFPTISTIEKAQRILSKKHRTQQARPVVTK